MKTFLIALLFACVPAVRAEMLVIGHVKNGIESLTAKQVQDIYLGRSRMLPNGKFALPIDQPSPLRAEFYEKLTGRPVEQINAYWARIMFTGQASPPQQLPSDDAVIQTVRQNEGAIGYINKSSVDETVRILLKLD
ncbi:hypothetical protein [Methylomonas methanica]|uniref:Phosphate ABC transporter substrate-binding protein n=1 Tax=Methylomonas methanica (strain DSM 25384 / MC09) TaxID=857087 RepID=F9ZXB7_METMM|nr:hypothetical protein [Methylomonas methanica]AEF99727.1 hypothetical protein Metme_1301 [Methylomonas methanica MC09]